MSDIDFRQQWYALEGKTKNHILNCFLILQGVMKCPECKGKLQIRISADDVSLHMNLFCDYFVLQLLVHRLVIYFSYSGFHLGCLYHANFCNDNWWSNQYCWSKHKRFFFFYQATVAERKARKTKIVGLVPLADAEIACTSPCFVLIFFQSTLW